MPNAVERLGPISADQSYPIEIFSKLTGLGTWGLRKARQAGLKVKTVGRRRYVRGADWHAFLADQK